jgi:RNA polymerase sigma-70 factor (ECF subfamily)
MMNNLSSDSTRTDPRLLGEVRDPRNHAAWEKFISRYRPMIRGWCYQWFPHEADNKTCEVLSELIFRMITFEYNASEGRFRGWLKTVTHNMMAGLKKDLLPQAGDDHNQLDLAEAGEDLAARLAAEFDLELLETAKERVRGRVQPHTWRAYVATAEEWRKPAEVARELGMKIGTVFQAKHSVIALLKQEIELLQSPA